MIDKSTLTRIGIFLSKCDDQTGSIAGASEPKISFGLPPD